MTIRGQIMRFTATSAAALLACALAAPAWAQTATDSAAQSGQPADAAQTGAHGPAGAQPAGADQTGSQGQSQPADAAAQSTTTGEASGAAQTPSQPAEAAAQPAQGEQPAEGAAQPAEGDKGYAMGDVVLGDPDAPLTVIEYASFTCPHCATFAVQTFPQIEEQYIDTGKVKFILREVYFDQYGLWASMVARCGGEKGFYPMAESLLASQSTWTRAPDIGHALQQVGRRAGLTGERLEQCLSDRDFAKELLAAYQANMEQDKVTSTPTFIIGDETHTGAMSVEDFSALLDAQL